MTVKEAVTQAKQHISELFQDEAPANIGLEEVEHDEQADEWRITIGFSRPWDTESLLAALNLTPRRSYKVVRISGRTADVLSVKNREDSN